MSRLGRIAAMTVAIVVILAGTLWFSLPYLAGTVIKISCHDPLTDNCKTRVRALGHALAYSGDLGNAAAWYGWAARNGDPVAMFDLGWTHYAREIEAASKLPHPGSVSAEDWRREAVLQMGGFPAKEACDWFLRSASLGFAPAMNNVGECYLHGIGFPRSERAARQWHLKAADAGNPVAAANLVVDYMIGAGQEFPEAGDETSERAEMRKWASARLDTMNRADLDEPTLAYTLRMGAAIPAAERRQMRMSPVTPSGLQKAEEQAFADIARACSEGRIECHPLPHTLKTTFRDAVGRLREAQ